MKKVLFLVNGMGLGNSTRTYAVIERMNLDRAEIHVATSGNGLHFFRDRPEVKKIFALRGFHYGVAAGKLSFARSLASIPFFLGRLLRNQFTLFRLFREHQYAAAVIDSEYSVVPLNFFFRFPLIAINNADVVVHTLRRERLADKAIRRHFLVEKLDFWFHQKFPDQVFSPSLAADHDFGKVIHVPPIVRRGILPSPGNAVPPVKVVVMLSGSKLGTSDALVHALRGFPAVHFYVLGRSGESSENVTYLGKVFENSQILRSADALILNAGFSAVSEAVALAKPTIVVPISGHAEQYANSRTLEKLGLAIVADEKNITEKLVMLLWRFNEYPTFPARHAFPLNGAERVAAAIEGVLR